MRARIALVVATLAMSATAAAQEPVKLFAAGSLRGVMTAIA